MGLEILEKKYQHFREAFPEKMPALHLIAQQVADVQLRMRDVLDGVTAAVCPQCVHSCCRCMPVEGWFTESDYFIYRTRHAAPFALRVQQLQGTGCAFLSSTGCVLPADVRPFPCVKVNCREVTAALEEHGRAAAFTSLYHALSMLQEQIWPLIADYLSPTVVQAQSL